MIPLRNGISFSKVRVPFWNFFSTSRAQGCSEGWVGAMNVLIRAGSPVENTQRYFYILFREGSSPRARGSCRDIPWSFPIIYPWVMRDGDTSDPEGKKRHAVFMELKMRDDPSSLNISRLSCTATRLNQDCQFDIFPRSCHSIPFQMFQTALSMWQNAKNTHVMFVSSAHAQHRGREHECALSDCDIHELQKS